MSLDDNLSKWFPYVGHEIKMEIGNFIGKCIKNFPSDFMKFMFNGNPGESLIDIIDELSTECNEDKSLILISATSCYFFSWLASFTFDGVDTGRIIDIIRCYLYIDFIIDSGKYGDGDSAKDFLECVKEIVKDDCINLGANNPLNPNLPKRWEKIMKFYRRMISSDTSQKTLRNLLVTRDLLKIELESQSFQKNPNHSRESYLKMCRDKGEYSAIMIGTIIGVDLSVEDNLKNFKSLGYVCQLLDDIVDVTEDREAGIHTIATHDLKEKGHLDELFTHTVEVIDSFDSPFILYKYAFLVVLTHVVSQPHKLFSSELQRIVDPYIYIDYRYCPSFKVMAEQIFTKE